MKSVLLRCWLYITLMNIILVMGSLEAKSQGLDNLAKLNTKVMDLYRKRKFSDAVPFAKQAIKETELKFGRDHFSLSTPLNNLAALHQSLNQLAEAEAGFKRSLALTEKKLGPNHPSVGISLTNLALVYQNQNRFGEAEALYKRAQAINEKAFGLNDISVGTLLNNLGGLYFAQHNYATAESIYRRSLTISEGALGRDHPDVGTILSNLAEIYQSQGRYGDAEPLLIRNLTINEKSLGLDHPDLVDTLEDLAKIYKSQGRFSDAERIFNRCLAINQKAFGTDDVNVVTTLNNIAILYQTASRYIEAEAIYQRSLNIATKVFGSEHQNVGTILNNLGSLYQSTEKYNEALNSYLSSLAILDKNHGSDDVSLASLLNNIGSLRFTEGLYNESELYFSKSLAIYERQSTSKPISMSIPLNNLSATYDALGRYNDVEALLRRSYKNSETLLGPNHPQTMLIAGNIGRFLKSEGRIDEALPLLELALTKSRESLGMNHSQSIGAALHVAELYGLQGRTSEANKIFNEIGVAKPVNLKEFPIYFATNRKRIGSDKRIAFGTERNPGSPHFGIARITILSANANGLRNTSGDSVETSVGDLRQVALQPVSLSEADELIRAARSRLLNARSSLGQALIFIHGYNTSFENAARRAGQLAFDLDFDGPVFLFSWPSREKTLSYIADRESAQLSADALRNFIISVVGATNAKRIHVVAHSMGNVALVDAIHGMDSENLAKLNFGELVLASPDLDPDLFKRTYDRLKPRGANSTIYASSNDRALKLSSWLHDAPQLGYIPTSGPKHLVDGADLIDVTGVNTDIFSLNHDTYANSPSVIADLRVLMKNGLRPPDVRTSTLSRVRVAGGVYWRYIKPSALPLVTPRP